MLFPYFTVQLALGRVFIHVETSHPRILGAIKHGQDDDVACPIAERLLPVGDVGKEIGRIQKDLSPKDTLVERLQELRDLLTAQRLKEITNVAELEAYIGEVTAFKTKAEAEDAARIQETNINAAARIEKAKIKAQIKAKTKAEADVAIAKINAEAAARAEADVAIAKTKAEADVAIAKINAEAAARAEADVAIAKIKAEAEAAARAEAKAEAAALKAEARRFARLLDADCKVMFTRYNIG
eukprot:m51a1_g12120 hypothetical protein (241) ;mRNA; f:8-1138